MNKATYMILTLALPTFLVGCGLSQEDVDNKIDAAQQSIINKVSRAIDNCEGDLDGLQMDDGCLEDTFRSGGDFYDCEISPDFTVIDGDCLRGELGI